MWKKFKNIFSTSKNDGRKNVQPCILIVDDSEVDRKLIRGILKKAGYRILLAENGEVGLNIARAERPDLIVLDCEMPVMDGLQMCKNIKQPAKDYCPPVLFLTGSEPPINVINCFELEASNFLQKPVVAQQLLSEVANIFKDVKEATG